MDPSSWSFKELLGSLSSTWTWKTRCCRAWPLGQHTEKVQRSQDKGQNLRSTVSHLQQGVADNDWDIQLGQERTWKKAKVIEFLFPRWLTFPFDFSARWPWTAAKRVKATPAKAGPRLRSALNESMWSVKGLGPCLAWGCRAPKVHQAKQPRGQRRADADRNCGKGEPSQPAFICSLLDFYQSGSLDMYDSIWRKLSMGKNPLTILIIIY